MRPATVRDLPAITAIAVDAWRQVYSSLIGLHAVERYLDGHWNSDGLRAKLAGWANLGHHWRLDIARSQKLGLPAALLAGNLALVPRDVGCYLFCHTLALGLSMLDA